MLNSSQFTRAAVIAATVLALGAGPAMARPAEQPAPSKVAVTTDAHGTGQWTQPRVDSTGVRPVVSAPPAVPLTRVADASGGTDWLSIAMVALTMLALLTIVALRPAVRHRAQSFRQV